MALFRDIPDLIDCVWIETAPPRRCIGNQAQGYCLTVVDICPSRPEL
jgi:hypothetical protein